MKGLRQLFAMLMAVSVVGLNITLAAAEDISSPITSMPPPLDAETSSQSYTTAQYRHRRRQPLRSSLNRRREDLIPTNTPPCDPKTEGDCGKDNGGTKTVAEDEKGEKDEGEPIPVPEDENGPEDDESDTNDETPPCSEGELQTQDGCITDGAKEKVKDSKVEANKSDDDFFFYAGIAFAVVAFGSLAVFMRRKIPFLSCTKQTNRNKRKMPTMSSSSADADGGEYARVPTDLPPV